MNKIRICSLTLIIFISCNGFQKNKTHQQVSNESIKAGEKLASVYCATCHQLPDPSLLDAKSWENGVLPQMGPRLGIFFYGNRQYPSSKYDFNVHNYYPEKQVISYDDWQHIIDYYTATSPDTLVQTKQFAAITINNKLFQPMRPAFTYNTPSTLLVKIENDHRIFITDAFSKKLFAFNNKLQLTDSTALPGAVTDVIADDSNNITICNTGILNPNNGKFGSIENISLHDTALKKMLFNNLMRPVQLSVADINADGKKDYVVCEFGNLMGALSWYENKDSGYERHEIRPMPGNIKIYITDYNKDGLPDIWALFAQGDESIYLFTNKGNGNFDAKQVLRFPPCNGSSSFELDDFNKDGFPDIVYSCGDNADYSVILKPYHGVYIFLNDGKNNFTQKYFYAINGCYKAIAKDFDGDGDLDIATIAFFADFSHKPQEGFVYLKNDGNFNFTPYTIDAARYGRWLTMDSGDIDGDGKPDLILGNFSVAPAMSKPAIDWTKQPPFLVLRNIQ